MQSDQMVSTILEGWSTYQGFLIDSLRPLDAQQLARRSSDDLRSVDLIARHMIGARGRWFKSLVREEDRAAFQDFATWDRPQGPVRSAGELVRGLERTFTGMQAAIESWTPEQWAQTYPGDGETEPKVLTMYWVIWHLIEHDLHHGGEISLTLGMHGGEGLGL
jgi:uncharacterized damage-inducible protein DinB